MRHRLLQRQLRKLNLNAHATPSLKQWGRFIEMVERAYGDSDQEQDLLERSLEISSREMQELYDNLKQASEARYRAIFEGVHDAIIVESMHGEILDVNSRACKLYGWTREEFLTKTIDDLVPEDAVPVLPDELEGEETSEHIIQTVNTRADGTYFPAEVSVTLETLGDERVMLVVVRDITARKETEEELIRSKERLRILFEFAPDAYYLSDLKGTFLDGNAAAEKLSGYPRDELIGSSFLEASLLDKKDIPRAAKLLANNILGHSTGPDIFELIRKNGERVTVEITTYPVRIGGQTLVLGIARDITDRIKAEQAIKDSEERFRSVAETAGDAIILMDDTFKIQYWNKAAADIFSYQSEEVINKDVTTVIPDIATMKPQRTMKRQARAKSRGSLTNPAELLGQRKNGDQFPIELSLASWRSGQKEYSSAIVRDVSEIRESQKRTHLQDRLAAVGQLAAGIAHDFNNILGTVTLYSELIMKSEVLLPKDRQRIKTIFEQAQRGAKLTAQILDFGRKSMMERHPFDLIPFFTELENLLSRTLPENVDLRFEFAVGRPYFVDADPTRMQQVVMNLALNATYAMPDGGGLLFNLDKCEIRERNKPYPTMKSGTWVRILVSDSGKGIPPDVLPHIFEPFFTTKPLGEGTGLGLAQVYGIIKQHDGYIDVESEISQGTTFTIYLPALDEMPILEPSVQLDMTTTGSGETILVVEDDTANRTAIAEILESIGYNVMQVEDGQKALQTLEQEGETIHLIVSDVVMPNLGGKDLYEAVVQKYPTIRIVLITGYPLGHGTRRLFDRHKVNWLQKPVDSETLAQVVRDMLA
jgi:two-component system cell cycle sensor histidine kinase/response regulator CckA